MNVFRLVFGDTASLSPGSYMRLRRQAADLSRIDLARTLVPRSSWAWHARLHHLVDLEEDRVLAGAGELGRMSAVINLDPTIYCQLAARMPTPPICGACGYSQPPAWLDPDSPAWPKPDLCTACMRKGAP